MPERQCPLLLRPQRASADRLVGDKSNSVTLVAGALLSDGQRASPSSRCQHYLGAPAPKNPISSAELRGEREGAEEEEEEKEVEKRMDRFDLGQQGSAERSRDH
ncbi:unnamed protein product [Pleuronectes platessa]|uniref:Uncharacterized protein n=1 Tax=Pleuronectes platessa TaxID=8262 RepID=A0A9N7UVH7_PLEPL|nr:unnamed protein product [Pleuronectes platessa]